MSHAARRPPHAARLMPHDARAFPGRRPPAAADIALARAAAR
jgi:hypothetical protein